MEIVYSTQRTPLAKGRTFRNPRHFQKPVEGAEKVIVIGDWPAVVSAYRKAGVPVEVKGANPPATGKVAAPPASLVERIRETRGYVRSTTAADELWAPPMTDDALRTEIKRLTGRAPHWNAKRETLERMHREASGNA